MKRLFAILLSLLLFWMQTFVRAHPVKADAPAICTCCPCQQTDCCVTQAPTDPVPLPAATAQTGLQSPNSFFLPAAIAWTLPRGAADFSFAGDVSPLSASRVPLFRRDCALLI